MMRYLSSLVSVLGMALALNPLIVGAADPPVMTVSDERINQLVQQLGNNLFARREAAGKELEKIGEKALPALQRALDKNEDLEIRSRVPKVIRRILLQCRKSAATGMELALIEEGEFQMGAERNEFGRRVDETPRKVRITRA